MSNKTTSLRVPASLFVTSIILTSSVVSAQSWVGSNLANWNVATNWNPAVDPNASNAVVTVGGASVPFIPGTITRSVGTLNISTATGGVNLGGGGRLSIHTTLTNAGTINVGGTTATYLQPVGNITFSGTGAVVLGASVAGPGEQAVIGDLNNPNSANDWLTNAANHTIRGRGTIGLANTLRITNNGVIESSVSGGRLRLLPSNLGLTNAGTLRAAPGAALDFDGANGGSFDNTSGIIDVTASGGSLLLNGARIFGGTINGTTGTIGTSTTGTLENLTLNARSSLNPGGALTLVGTIVNNGELRMIANTAVAFLQPRGTVTLNGTGSIDFSGIAGATIGDNANVNAANDHLINGLNHTIKGEGTIGLTNTLRITNNGLIDAIYSRPIVVRAGVGGFENNGTLRATTSVTIDGGVQSGSGNFVVLNPTSVMQVTNGATGNTAHSVTGQGIFRVTGTATDLTVSHVRTGTLEVLSPARLSLGAAGNSGASRVTTLTINGRLNLRETGIVVDYTGSSPFSTIRGYVLAGRGTGNWQGTSGILTSIAASVAGFGVGLVEASALGSPTQFMGQTSDATSILVRATYLGDTNLDGAVDFLDLLNLARNYGLNANGTWAQGDSNYDNAINFSDLLELARNYGNGTSNAATGDFLSDWALAQSMVPEPATLMSLAIPSLIILRRRRGQ